MYDHKNFRKMLRDQAKAALHFVLHASQSPRSISYNNMSMVKRKGSRKVRPIVLSY